jgi:hypothetical protein
VAIPSPRLDAAPVMTQHLSSSSMCRRRKRLAPLLG